MIIKKIKYEDYDGNILEEEFRFNLNKAEVMKLATSKNGGYDQYITRIMAAQDLPGMLRVLDEIVLQSYGVKSADGKRFEKSEQATKDFMDSAAYVELYTELFLTGDEKALVDFITGILPRDLEKMSAAMAS